MWTCVAKLRPRPPIEVIENILVPPSEIVCNGTISSPLLLTSKTPSRPSPACVLYTKKGLPLCGAKLVNFDIRALGGELIKQRLDLASVHHHKSGAKQRASRSPDLSASLSSINNSVNCRQDPLSSPPASSVALYSSTSQLSLAVILSHRDLFTLLGPYQKRFRFSDVFCLSFFTLRLNTFSCNDLELLTYTTPFDQLLRPLGSRPDALHAAVPAVTCVHKTK